MGRVVQKQTTAGATWLWDIKSFADLAHACFAAMGEPARVEYFDTPEHIRRHYQYHTQAAMDRLRQAGYDRPATSLEDGVRRYIQDYLATNDPYR